MSKEKPKKKEILVLNANFSNVNDYVRHKERVIGYNQAISDYEQFLPSEDSINTILWKASYEWHNTHGEGQEGYIRYLAHAIWSRLNDSKA